MLLLAAMGGQVLIHAVGPCRFRHFFIARCELQALVYLHIRAQVVVRGRLLFLHRMAHVGRVLQRHLTADEAAMLDVIRQVVAATILLSRVVRSVGRWQVTVVDAVCHHLLLRLVALVLLLGFAEDVIE